MNLIETSKEFMTEFGQSPNVDLYMQLVLEELYELRSAAKPEDQYQEAADVLYVVGGLFHSLELNAEKLEAAYQQVHQSNLSKLSDSPEIVQAWIEADPNRFEAIVAESPSGKYYALHTKTGKVLKGPNHKPVNLSNLFTK